MTQELNDQWPLYAGSTWTGWSRLKEISVQNEDVPAPRIPTGDRQILSLGAGWSPTGDLIIDLAYYYLKEEAVTVNNYNELGQAYNAQYENWANGFGLGATYRF